MWHVLGRVAMIVVIFVGGYVWGYEHGRDDERFHS